MDSEQEKKMLTNKNELELGNILNSELKAIKENGSEWHDMKSIVVISNEELLDIADTRGLKDDPQTRSFCNFISVASVFSSLSFKEKLSRVPQLIKSIKDLIDKMLEEIKEFADIAIIFRDIIQAYVRLVLETKKNMNMVQPYMRNSKKYIEIYVDALTPGKDGDLSDEDKRDIETALERLVVGVENLTKDAKSFENKSYDIEERIKVLRGDISTKITIVDGRINLSKGLPALCGAVGASAAGGVALAGINSTLFGGIGAFVISGYAFPPLGVILTAMAIGGLACGGIVWLVNKLWDKHQYIAIGYLKDILKHLDELNVANLKFRELLDDSFVKGYSLKVDLNELKANAANGSRRFKEANIDIANRVIESSDLIIKCIQEINDVKLDNWSKESEITDANQDSICS